MVRFFYGRDLLKSNRLKVHLRERTKNRTLSSVVFNLNRSDVENVYWLTVLFDGPYVKIAVGSFEPNHMKA